MDLRQGLNQIVFVVKDHKKTTFHGNNKLWEWLVMLDVGATKRRREYYTGEGGGFPRVRAMVSLVSSKSQVACPNTKSVPESELTNLLVGLMHIRPNNEKLITLPNPIPELQHVPLPPFNAKSWERAPNS